MAKTTFVNNALLLGVAVDQRLHMLRGTGPQVCFAHKYTSVGDTSIGVDHECLDGWVFKVELGRVAREVGEADTFVGGCAVLCEGSKQVFSDGNICKFRYITCPKE